MSEYVCVKRVTRNLRIILGTFTREELSPKDLCGFVSFSTERNTIKIVNDYREYCK